MRSGVFEIGGKTIGIIGLGNIGRLVAGMVRGFGPAEVIYFDTATIPAEVEAELDVRSVGFEELLETSDIVTVHVPLYSDTRGFMNARAFSLMKETAIFVNTDRQTGEVTRQTAKNSIQDGKLLCEVQNSDGSVSTHSGRIEDGYLFWSHVSNQKIESFREWVDGEVYYIEGFGVYGGVAFMFVGKYKRVGATEAENENAPAGQN